LSISSGEELGLDLMEISARRLPKEPVVAE